MAVLPILTSTPKCSQKIANIGDAIDKLQAFNALYQAAPETSSYNNCGDGARAEFMQSLIRHEVINCGKATTEIDILEQMAGGVGVLEIPAKEYTTFSHCGIDWNVFAQNAVVGTGPGVATQFQLHKQHHSGNGKYSPIAEGNDIFIYEDGQLLRVIDVDKTNDYGHLITVLPRKTAYTVNIRANRKMFVEPARMVGAIACNAPASRWETPGYSNTLRPLRADASWELPIDLMRGFTGVLRFAVILDAEGREVTCFIPQAKQDARLQMKVRKNVEFFLGQSVDNAAHPIFSDPGGSGDYTGFEGLRPTIQNAGGNILDFDPSIGFDFQSNFKAMIRKNDALKETKEYTVFAGLNFNMGLDEANNGYLKNSSITFETFTRSGMKGEDITKLGIKSYSYLDWSLHFKTLTSLTDSRVLGNSDIAEEAYFLPGDGITNSSGESVSAIEMFMPYGCGKQNFNGYMEERDIDHRNAPGQCEKLSGYLRETIMIGFNCPHKMLYANPDRACA